VWIAAMHSSGRHVGWLAASFARGGRFRVELYLDAGDAIATKRIFDQLFAERTRIEGAVGGELSWERLDNRQASRIARYWSARISDPPQALTILETEAAAIADRMYAAFRSALSSLPNKL
jgi:hypothetical protein